jgi:chromosome segregation ATPase
MDDKTLADTIYQELVDGLTTGDLNWTHFIAKYGASKELLYNAIGRFFRDMEPEVRALNEAQAKLGEARLQLKSLNQRIKEADKVIKGKNHDIVGLEEKHNTLKKQIEALEGNLAQKDKTLERLQQLERLDFGKEKLETLYTTLGEIGSKRGLKPEEAAKTFLAELKDYDTKIGFKQEIQRLTAVTKAKKLEAEKWSVEAETCERKHKELQEAIGAIQSLVKQGVKPEQVVSWNNILTSIGGVEELEKGLDHHKSVQSLLAAKKKEQQQLDAKLVEASAAVKTLTEQRAELEASIKALRVSAVNEIERVSQASVEKITGVAQAGSNYIEQVGETGSAKLKEVLTLVDQVAAGSITSISQVGETALGQLKEALSLVDQVCARALEVSEIVDQTGDKLAKSKKIKESTATLVARIERAG